MNLVELFLLLIMAFNDRTGWFASDLFFTWSMCFPFTTIRGERKKGKEHLAIKVNGQFAIGDE